MENWDLELPTLIWDLELPILIVEKFQKVSTALQFSNISLILVTVSIARRLPVSVPVDMKHKQYFAPKYYSYLIIIWETITYYTDSSIVYHLVSLNS